MTSAETMAAFFHRRAAEERARVAQRSAGLRMEAAAFAATLRSYGARRVWLFGSLAWGVPDAHADIDLAVEGLPRSIYFAALGELLSRGTTSVDLVAMEEIPEAFAARIRTHGIELSET